MTPFLAEFYNSLSSLIFVGVALYGLQKSKLRQDPYVVAAFVWLIAIGIGSFAFHGTMKHHMQLADEIPMVGFMGTLLIAKVVRPGLGHPWVSTTKAATLWVFVTIVVCLSLLWIYIILDLYEIFVHGFTMLVLLHTTITYKFPKNYQSTRTIKDKQYIMDWCSNTSLIVILLGRVVWETENRLCQQYPYIWPLHTLWHGLSCLSAYYSVILTWLLRLESSRESTTTIAMKSLSLWGVPTASPTRTEQKEKSF
mmetsp:Transcript_6810/g.9597  ORF Transcript_6810/g.9597 Transcript_6810/m.9597 type:complete len:253 (+) Transcript_6810:121-879(+)